MKIRSMVALGGLGAAGLAFATGFPRRIGATRLEAALSLPGDDLLAQAPVVVDRAVDIEATPDTVWAVLHMLLDEEEEMLIRAEVENQSLVLASADVDRDMVDTAADVDATWAFVLTARADGTTRLHLRERHQPHNTAALLAAWADVTASSWTTMRVLYDVKRVAQMEEEVFLMEATEEAEQRASESESE